MAAPYPAAPTGQGGQMAENLPLCPAVAFPPQSQGAAATFLVTLFFFYCQIQIYKEVPVFISTLVFSTREA